ncbi:MAG: UMP kinase [Archaeoglobaceae archaeon]|nr:UMP kinase [Archaeoglobaceae archaeon]MDW8127787.1 UMP kinase [Archaeoglobaceae archaeon]
MRIVLSLGGSVFEGDANRIRNYAKVLDQISEENKLFVVVGGGKLAREFIKKARELGANETMCDYLGIAVTRINAMLLAFAMKNSAKRIPETFIEAEELSKSYKAVVMGGTFPGHTTDATSALLAEFVNAELFLNATSVDGIYSEDPRRNPNAKKFDKITSADLVKLVASTSMEAGANVVIDLLSAKIIERSKLKTIVFKGEPENIIKVLKGEKIGTVVEP